MSKANLACKISPPRQSKLNIQKIDPDLKPKSQKRALKDHANHGRRRPILMEESDLQQLIDTIIHLIKVHTIEVYAAIRLNQPSH